MALHLPNVRITQAFAPRPAGSPATAAPLPRCRVEGVIDKETGFFVLLPDHWNGRFVMGGGGAFDGGLFNTTNASPADGYAVAGTDGGHQAASFFSGIWALHNDERMVSFFYLAVHRTTQVAKDIIRSYYGAPPTKSYFDGCSTGGREALAEAARYPEDYDGIIARAPGGGMATIISATRNLQAEFPTGDFSKPVLNADNLKLLETKVLDACDARDGVRDSVIDDPRSCDFKPASLPACAEDAPAADCVTRAQRQLIETIYSPVRLNGVVVSPGQLPGEEMAWLGAIIGVDSSVLKATRNGAPNQYGAMATELFKYFVFGDSTWDYSRYDLSRMPVDLHRLDSLARGTNIGAFLRHGGKLILAHGWSDEGISPLSTIAYYDSVMALPGARNGVRLFMMPGVRHCRGRDGGGGEGCDTVDWIAAIVDWVEHGNAPARLIAKKLGTAPARDAPRPTVRTRPLCPYPQHAVYTGTGSTDNELNFVCRDR